MKLHRIGIRLSPHGTGLVSSHRAPETLAALSRQKGTTVSELVRESVREKYMSRKEMDKVSLARQLSGIWKRRRDLKDVDGIIRGLRKGTRLKKLGIG